MLMTVHKVPRIHLPTFTFTSCLLRLVLSVSWSPGGTCVMVIVLSSLTPRHPPAIHLVKFPIRITVNPRHAGDFMCGEDVRP